MADQMIVAKVKGAEPEQFLSITLSEDFGTVLRTSGAMSETELRATLRKAGMPDWEITSHIEHARKHPVQDEPHYFVWRN
jgi:hypothetical protein